MPTLTAPRKSFLKTSRNRVQIVNARERTYQASHRYVSAFDLWTRFTELKAKYDKKVQNRKNIIKMYERQAYRNGRDPNWGQFRGMVGKAIKQMVNVFLNRKVWCRIETYEGYEDDKSLSWSDDITEAFHECCIKPWHAKDQMVIAMARDSVLWNKSFAHWSGPLGCFPCQLDIDDVYFDMNTKLCLRSTCEMCFVRKRHSLIDLYELATDPDYAAQGWNKEALFECITDFADTLKSENEDSVTEVFKRGGLTQDHHDKRISLLYCYVKEYKECKEGEKKGNQFTLFVIPESAMGFGLRDANNSREVDEAKKRDFLRMDKFHCKSISEVVAVQSMHYMDSVHSEDSFARQIFTTCRFYDNAMNRMIRAALRALKLYIVTTSTKTKEQLMKSDDSEVEFLGDSDKIEQVQVRQQIGDIAQIARRAVIDMNEQFGTDFKGSADSAKDYPITAKEAEIQSSALNDSNATDIKISVSQNRDMVDEIYRRFVETNEECEEYKHFKRFQAIMKRKKIPNSAWAYENVCIFARYNQFAGSASASITAARALMEATQITTSSPAEARAKRNVISSITNEANVSEFDNEVAQFDNELFVIGQENIALDNPLALPINVAVGPIDSHPMHARGHIMDMGEKLSLANQMLEMYAQTPSYRRLFLLNDVANIVNAQDRKGAHVQGHFQMIAKDENRKGELAELRGLLAKVNQQQDMLVANVRKAQEAEETNQQIVSKQDQEFAHAERMNQLKIQEMEAQANYSLGKVASQTQARQETTEQNQKQKAAHKKQDQTLKAEDKAIEIAAKTEKARIDLTHQATKNELDRRNRAAQNAEKKPASKS